MANNQILALPLYGLHYIDDVSEFSGMGDEDTSRLIASYDASVITELALAVFWACDNPDQDLTDIPPSMPRSNEERHEFLERIRPSFEKSPLKDIWDTGCQNHQLAE